MERVKHFLNAKRIWGKLNDPLVTVNIFKCLTSED